MPNPGNSFRDALIQEILSWNIPELDVYTEAYVGSRFIGQKRKLDIVLHCKNRSLGIEAKTQQTGGTAYQKLPYTIQDAKSTPIPVIIVFSGDEIRLDVKAMLISSGVGMEIEWTPEKGFGFGVDILKQRILIDLGLDWLEDQRHKKVNK